MTLIGVSNLSTSYDRIYHVYLHLAMWCRSSKLEPTASLLLPAAAAVLVRDDDFSQSRVVNGVFHTEYTI